MVPQAQEDQESKVKRTLCWYSAGVTSMVAAMKAKECGPITVAYCDTGGEHPDNVRFIKDCERLLGQEIIILRSEKYESIWDVFEKTRYLSGVKGARCTTEMKKLVRRGFEDLENDIQVFGFDNSEKIRAEKFVANNPEVTAWFPLIEGNISKQECLDIIAAAGIELPAMYKMGYKNNNCIGCVKGQSGYWNKIRVDFPEVFDRMAKQERLLNVALNKSYAGDGKRKRVFLDELDPTAGRYDSELEIKCGLICGE